MIWQVSLTPLPAAAHLMLHTLLFTHCCNCRRMADLARFLLGERDLCGRILGFLPLQALVALSAACQDLRAAVALQPESLWQVRGALQLSCQ